MDRSRVVVAPGFSATRGLVLVLNCLLVLTLWMVDRWRVVSFFLALLLPAGAAVWIGAEGEVGVSDRIVAVAMSRVGVSSSTGLFVGDEEGS